MSNIRHLDPSPTTLLRLDHRWICELFRLLADTPESELSKKQSLFEELRTEIRRHLKIVDQHLAAVVEMNGQAPEDGLEFPETIFLKATDEGEGPEARLAFLSLLEQAFERHILREERDCFPLVDQLPEAMQKDLSLGILRTRDQVVAAVAGS